MENYEKIEGNPIDNARQNSVLVTERMRSRIRDFVILGLRVGVLHQRLPDFQLLHVRQRIVGLSPISRLHVCSKIYAKLSIG